MTDAHPDVTVWFARTGPCWCTGRPGRDGSYDLERLRRWRVPASPLLDRDVLICPELVTPGILSQVERLLSMGRMLSVSYPLCPGARDGLPGELVAAFGDGGGPSMSLSECVSGYPELLALELVGHLARSRPEPSCPRESALLGVPHV